MSTPIIANRYHLHEKLGEGAMGLVYLVDDTTTGLPVALKLISDTGGERGGAGALLQFKQEFRLMTQLRHPHCCAVYDYGQGPDGAPFYTMEVVPGKGLDELLPMPMDEVKRVLGQLLLALGYVHALGLVHRDIKSANVRVRPDGMVKLMDYGLMEYAGRADAPISGTIGYLSPEVIRRGLVDSRADLYSLGALVYEMMVGQLPFPRTTRLEILRAHAMETPTPPGEIQAGVDPVLEGIVLKLLAKEPVDRYQSALEVLDALGIERPSGIGGNLLSPPLIGRDYETMRLYDYLGTIAEGQPGGALLWYGPPGIGKTRVVGEFRSVVQLESVPFVCGKAREQGGTPYGPFREVLKGLLPELQIQVPDVLAEHAPVLFDLMPSLGEHDAFPGLEAAVPMDSLGKEKVRLQAAVTEILRALSAKQPLIIHLEDWQWADALSTDLLDYVLRNTSDRAILTIITSRVLPPGSPAWLEGVAKQAISPLGANDVRRLVTAMLGTEEVDASFLDEVVQLSEGNPFYVERLLEHLVTQGLLVQAGGAWKSEADLAAAGMPRDLQGLLLRKLALLTEDAMTLARTGAVLGREFGIELLKQLTSFHDDRLFDALGVLLRQKVVVQNDQRSYAFAQVLFKELLYGSFKPEQRTAMHARVAETLERQVKRGGLAAAPIETVMAIADHYMLGCVPDKIVAYAMEAGRRSAGLFAQAEADRYLDTALTLLRTQNTRVAQSLKLEALRLLGDLRRLNGQSEAARDLYLEAVPLAQHLGEQGDLGRMLTALADVYLSLDNFQEALMCCQRSLELSLGNGDKAGAARSYLTSCVILFMAGNLNRAIEHTETALSLAREIGDKTAVAEALAFMGHLYVAAVPDKAQAGIASLQEAVVILAELNNKLGLQNAYNLLGAAQFKQGDYTEAWESFTHNRQICFELGLKEEEAYALLNLSITAFERGHMASGIKHTEEADAQAKALGSTMLHGLASAFRSAGKAYVGRLKDARVLAGEALGLFKGSNNKYLEARILEHRVSLLVYMGQFAEARETCEALLELLQETGNMEPESHVRAMLGEVLGRQGELAAAEASCDRALADARAAQGKGVQIAALKTKAWIVLQRGEFSDARQCAREALILSYQAGTRYLTAELQGLLGEIDLAEGKGEPGPYFAAMENLANEMGTPLLQAIALFGQAAARPYEEGAGQKAARAQQVLHAMLVGLDAESVERFSDLTERRRVLNGNYIDLSIKRSQKPSGPAPSRGTGIGFSQGMW